MHYGVTWLSDFTFKRNPLSRLSLACVKILPLGDFGVELSPKWLSIALAHFPQDDPAS